MQVVFENENKRNDSRRTGVVDVDICTRRSSWCLERNCNTRFGDKNIGVWNSREVFRRNKEKVWRGGWRVEESNRIKGSWARTMNYGWIYSDVEKSGKEW